MKSGQKLAATVAILVLGFILPVRAAVNEALLKQVYYDYIAPQRPIIATVITPVESRSLDNAKVLSLAMNNLAFNRPLDLNLKNTGFTPSIPRSLEQKIKLDDLENTLFTTSLITLAALNIADYLSTREALKYPGLEEANPLMKPFVKNPYTFAAVKVGFTVLSYVNMKIIYKKDKRLGWAMSIISNFALSYVVSNNLRLINEAKKR